MEKELDVNVDVNEGNPNAVSSLNVDPIYKHKDGRIFTKNQLLSEGYNEERIKTGLDKNLITLIGDTRDVDQEFKHEDGRIFTNKQLLSEGYTQERIDNGILSGKISPIEKKNQIASAPTLKDLQVGVSDGTISTIEPPKNAIDLSFDAFNLENQKITRRAPATIGFATGGGEVVTTEEDPQAKAASKKIKEDLKAQGYDADKLYDDFKDIDFSGLNKEEADFQKQSLLNDYKENPQQYEKNVATYKFTNFLNKAISELPEEERKSGNFIFNLSPMRDYNSTRAKYNEIKNRIKEYGGNYEKELLKNFSIAVGDYYGQFSNDPSVINDERKKYLNQYQISALQYLEDTNPDAAKGYGSMLVDPSLIKKGSAEEAGWQEKASSLEQIGLQLSKSNIESEILRLANQAKTSPLSIQDAALAKELETKLTDIDNKIKEINIKYPIPAEKEAKEAAMDLTDNAMSTWYNRAFLSVGNAVDNTWKGVYDFVSEPFRNDEQSKLYQLAAAGESVGKDIQMYLPQKRTSQQNYDWQMSPEVSSQYKAIMDDKSLSKDAKTQKVYKLLQDNPDGFARIPIVGGKTNITPTSLYYSVVDLGASLVPYLALESVTAGGATAGIVRKLASSFMAAAATGFHDNYVAAVREGAASPYKQALITTGIMSFAMAGAGTPQMIRAMAGNKTAIGELVSKLTDKEISVVLDKIKNGTLKNKILDFGKSLGKDAVKSIAEGAKGGLKFESIMAGAKAIDSKIKGQEVHPEELAKEGAIGVLNFTVFGGVMGISKSAWKGVTDFQGSTLLKASQNPTEYLKAAAKSLADGTITNKDYNQIKSNIELASKVSEGVKFIDDKGRELPESKKAKLLLAKMQEAKLNEDAQGDIPSKLKEDLNNQIGEVKLEIGKIQESEEEVGVPQEKDLEKTIPEIKAITDNLEQKIKEGGEDAGQAQLDLELIRKDPVAYYERLKEEYKKSTEGKDVPQEEIDATTKGYDDLINKIKESQVKIKETEAKTGKEAPKVEEKPTEVKVGEEVPPKAEEKVTEITPIENPKVVITGTRRGMENLGSANYNPKVDSKIQDARGRQFDENGILVETDNKGNQIVHIKVEATDAVNREGYLQVSVIVPKGTKINNESIKKIVDAEVEKIKAKDNEYLHLNEVQESDFAALRDAVVNELKNPSVEKVKVGEEVPQAEPPKAEEKTQEISDAEADIEKRRQEELKQASVDNRIKPGIGNQVKVGEEHNAGNKLIIENSITNESYDPNIHGDGYTVYSKIISDAEFDSNGKLSKPARVETEIFPNKETADKVLQERYERISAKEKQGTAKTRVINAKYDAELKALREKQAVGEEVTPKAEAELPPTPEKVTPKVEKPKKEPKVFSSASINRVEAKKAYKHIDSMDAPVDANGAAMHWLSLGGKISIESFADEVIGRKKSRGAAKIIIPTEAKKSEFTDPKSKKSVEMAAHEIWESLPDHIQEQVTDMDIRDALITNLNSYSKRIDIAKDFISEYDPEEAARKFYEAEMEENKAAYEKERQELEDWYNGISEEETKVLGNEEFLNQLIKEYENEYPELFKTDIAEAAKREEGRGVEEVVGREAIGKEKKPTAEKVERKAELPKVEKEEEYSSRNLPNPTGEFEVVNVIPYTTTEKNKFAPNQQLKFNQGDKYEPVRIVGDSELIELIQIGSRQINNITGKTKKFIDRNRQKQLEEKFGISAYDAIRKAKQLAKENRGDIENIIIIGEKPIEKVSEKVEPKPEPPKEEKVGKFEQQARKIAEKISKAELPDFMKTPEFLKDAKKSGLSAEDLQKKLADAVIQMGKLLDKGVEYSKAIKEAVGEIVKLRGEENREAVEKGFEEYYKGLAEEQKRVGLSKAEIAKQVEEFGMMQPSRRAKITDIELDQMADDAINAGYDVQGLIDRLRIQSTKPLEERQSANDLEIVILNKYAAGLNAEMVKNPSNETLKKYAEALDAAKKSLSIAGATLRQARNSQMVVDNLSNFLTDKQNAQGAPLTEKQLKEETAKFEELKAAKDALEEALKIEKEKNEKLIAEIGFNKAKALRKREAKKTNEEYKAERKAILDAAKEALQSIPKGGELYSTIPGLPQTVKKLQQLKTIAPFVKEYMGTLINQGVDKLDNVVTDIHAEFKDVVEGVTKNDILKIIAGVYDTPTSTRNEAASKKRLLEREAKLLNELSAARKGEEVAKTEKEKIEKSRRIQELERQIKETRELNREDAEPIEKTNAERLAAREKQLLNKIERLNQDLKSGNFLQEKKPLPPLEINPKTRALMNRVIELEEKIRAERAKDEYDKKPKWVKNLDKVSQVLGVRRLMQTAFDLSVSFRQGTTLFSPRNIKIWAKSFKNEISSITPERFKKLMYEIRHSESYHEMVEDGVVFNDLGTVNEDYLNANFMQNIPGIGQGLRASQRAADGFLNTARYELYQKFRKNLERQGLTRQSDPQAYKEMASWVMAMTGRGDMGKALENPSAQQILGNTFYGARLMASRFKLLYAPAYLLPAAGIGSKWRNKEMARESLKDMASWAGTVMAVGAALAATPGASISLNPDDSDFLQVRYGDKVYDISGGTAAYIRTFLRITQSLIARTTRPKYIGKKKVEKASESTLKFFRNKLAPNTSYAVDAIFGGSGGREFDPYSILKTYPMYGDDLIEGLEEEGVVSLATILLPNLIGIGLNTYSAKGTVEDNLETLIKNSQTADDQNPESIKNHNKGGVPITDEEFDKYIDKANKLIGEYVTKFYKNGKKIVNEDGTIVQKSYLELSPDEIANEIKSIKSKATKEAKEELFGTKSYEEKVEESKERARKKMEKIVNQ